MPKFLLQVSVRKLHNKVMIPSEEGGPEEAWDEDNHIIISDSTLKSILPPQLKNMTS